MTDETRASYTTLIVELGRCVCRLLVNGLLCILFYGVFTPVGFLVRLIGRDPLYRQLEPVAQTYYLTSKERSAAHMDNPF